MLQHWLKMALPGADFKATAMTSKRAAEALKQVSHWMMGGERLELIQAAEDARKEAKAAKLSSQEMHRKYWEQVDHHLQDVEAVRLREKTQVGKAFREMGKMERREEKNLAEIASLKGTVEALRKQLKVREFAAKDAEREMEKMQKREQRHLAEIADLKDRFNSLKKQIKARQFTKDGVELVD